MNIDNKISRIAEGARQGQLIRYEYMLLAAMGEQFLLRHPRCGESWFDDAGGRLRRVIDRFKKENIRVGWFDPLSVNPGISE